MLDLIDGCMYVRTYAIKVYFVREENIVLKNATSFSDPLTYDMH